MGALGGDPRVSPGRLIKVPDKEAVACRAPGASKVRSPAYGTQTFFSPFEGAMISTPRTIANRLEEKAREELLKR